MTSLETGGSLSLPISLSLSLGDSGDSGMETLTRKNTNTHGGQGQRGQATFWACSALLH